MNVLAPALLVTSACNLLASAHYVDLNSSNATPPYTNWATAATNIQDAVDAAVAGDEVVVTNGTYFGGVTVFSPLSLRSVNGPEVTTIDGGGQVRCTVISYGVNLSGFTLTHGFASAYYAGGGLGRGGAGVLCVGTNPVASIAVVSNCVITGNRVFANLRSILGGRVYGGTLNSCKLIDNSICVSTAFAGGTCSADGGGAYGSALNNCTLVGNSANATNTGGIPGSYAFAGGGGVYGCTLNNCTLTVNSANAVAVEPSLAFAGAAGCNLSNCVAYFNNDDYGVSRNYESACTLNHCCTTPLPSNGVGNITNDPLIVDTNGWANLRLQSNSPCINAGNNAFVPAGPDLDGNPRIAGGTVDIGAYEYQSPTSLISYAWLQFYGLSTDGSADFTDPDGDGMNNWQEWRCGTVPTNALSALRMFAPMPTGTNMLVTWQSVAGVNYFLERSTNLTASPAFVTLATGIEGQAGTTTFVDSNVSGAGPFFYRVGVEAP